MSFKYEYWHKRHVICSCRYVKKETLYAIAEYIYKQTNDKDPTIWRVVPVTVKRLVDGAIHPNQTYTYFIRATLTNGKFTQVKKVKVKF